MKYHVTVEFDVETSEYHEIGDSPDEVAELVVAMMAREADLPDNLAIKVHVNAKAPQPTTA